MLGFKTGFLVGRLNVINFVIRVSLKLSWKLRLVISIEKLEKQLKIKEMKDHRIEVSFRWQGI